ncbi:hypothetical protein ABZ705_23140 [Streptomyces sp. NPDC006984]
MITQVIGGQRPRRDLPALQQAFEGLLGVVNWELVSVAVRIEHER